MIDFYTVAFCIPTKTYSDNQSTTVRFRCIVDNIWIYLVYLWPVLRSDVCRWGKPNPTWSTKNDKEWPSRENGQWNWVWNKKPRARNAASIQSMWTYLDHSKVNLHLQNQSTFLPMAKMLRHRVINIHMRRGAPQKNPESAQTSCAESHIISKVVTRMSDGHWIWRTWQSRGTRRDLAVLLLHPSRSCSIALMTPQPPQAAEHPRFQQSLVLKQCRTWAFQTFRICSSYHLYYKLLQYPIAYNIYNEQNYKITYQNYLYWVYTTPNSATNRLPEGLLTSHLLGIVQSWCKKGRCSGQGGPPTRNPSTSAKPHLVEWLFVVLHFVRGVTSFSSCFFQCVWDMF